jgi:hypothetical protein
MHFAYVLGKTIHVLSVTGAAGYTDDPFFRKLMAAYVVGAAAYLFLLYHLARQSRRVAAFVLFAAAALYLTTLAGGIGGYLLQHGGFTVPSYVALALVVVRVLARQPHVARALPCCMAMAACAWTQSFDETMWVRRQPELLNRFAENRHTTEALDRLLDACGQAHYVFVGSQMKLAFARHSPIGPMFMLFHHDEYLGWQHPLYQTTRERIDDEGSILVQLGDTSDDRLQEGLGASLAAEFTDQPPPCAVNRVPIEGLRVLFRTQPPAAS